MAEPSRPVGRVVRVRPDEPGLDKLFDYVVPAALDEQVRVGSVVRIALAGRRVGGWVVADDVEPPDGRRAPAPGQGHGLGPAPRAARAGRLGGVALGRPPGVGAAHGHRGPRRAGAAPGPPPERPARRRPVAPDEVHDLAAEALAAGVATVRLPPAADPYPVLVAAAALGPILVVGPVASSVRRLGLRLRRAGQPVAAHARRLGHGPGRGLERVRHAGGGVGARARPGGDRRARRARRVAASRSRRPPGTPATSLVERARRLGVPCVMVSPTPVAGGARAGPAADPEPGGRAGRVAARRGHRPPGRPAGRGPVQRAPRAGAALRRPGGLHPQPQGPLAAHQLRQLQRGGHLRALPGRRGPGRGGGAGVPAVRHRPTRGLHPLRRHPDEEPAGRGEPRPGGARGPGPRARRRAHRRHRPRRRRPRHPHRGGHRGRAAPARRRRRRGLPRPRPGAARPSLPRRRGGARPAGPRRPPGRRAAPAAVGCCSRPASPATRSCRPRVMADPARVAAAEADRRRELAYPPATAMAVVSGPVGAGVGRGVRQPDRCRGARPRRRPVAPAGPRPRTRCAPPWPRCARPPGRVRVEVDPLRL